MGGLSVSHPSCRIFSEGTEAMTRINQSECEAVGLDPKEIKIIDVGIASLSKIELHRQSFVRYRKSKSKVGNRFVKVVPCWAINPFDTDILKQGK